MIIKPDIKLINEIISSGGGSLKKCFQCATCSAVCNISPENKPFPRKEIFFAQWGLSDKLFNNLDIWLCHQCGDCTAYCPRGVKPGEVISAIRRLAIISYSFPKFLANFLNKARYLPLIIGFPLIILLALTRNVKDGILFSDFISPLHLSGLFTIGIGFSLVSFIIGIKRFLGGVKMEGEKGSLIKAIFSTITEILLHSKFKKCNTNKLRYYAHLCIFYGFVLLIITAGSGIFYLEILQKKGFYPICLFHNLYLFLFFYPIELISQGFSYSLTYIMNFIGYSGVILMFIGLNLVIFNRINQKDSLGGYFDWLLIAILYIIIACGALTMVTRWANIPILSYPLYFIHLLSVFFLLCYAPYSKFAHFVYRTIAIIYAKQYNRDV
ncbi:MAG: quinone-interacting membrane-bound oxidoreductase complex subunit QmoC [bacterium]